jgi:uncharacterized protein (TIGR02453 family)
MGFDGFPKQTLTFLRGIGRNNNRVWFEAHRGDYERYWLEPARGFVEAAAPLLTKVAPLEAEARVNGSIFRINRDVRFTQDKRPYKDHLDLWFWEGDRSTASSGCFLRMTPTRFALGVGAHGFDRDRLRAYRDAVVDARSGRKLMRAVRAVEKAGFEVAGEQYTTAPRGYAAATPDQERMLRHGALWAGSERPNPPELHTAAIVAYCVDEWKKLKPLHRWLVDTLG